MTTFLKRILETKQEEIKALRMKRRELQVDALPSRQGKRIGFRESIVQQDALAVIAEVKKASPSKGLIAPNFDPVQIAQLYQAAGAACISVLTDEQYFQGSIAYLQAIREVVDVPLLRKDFILDELQIDEAVEHGADAVLLIAAALSTVRLRDLSTYAKSFGLDTLIEVHDVEELDSALAASPSVLGVNNRNLHTFEVSLETTRDVLKNVPQSQVVIAESGIQSTQDTVRMAEYGADGVLVGESLMRAGGAEPLSALLQSFRVRKKEPVQP